MMATSRWYALRALFLLAGLAGCGAAISAEWRVASGFGDTVFHTRNLRSFAATVTELSGGTLELNIHASGSLLPLASMRDGLLAGEAEVGEFLLADLAPLDPLFEVDSIPFLAPNYAKAEQLWAASKSAIEQRLAADGLQLLYAVPWPPQGLFSKRPLQRMADLKGRGMRVYNRPTQQFAELTGALPLVIASSELGAAMAGDQLELMLLPASTGARIDAAYFFSTYYDAMAWLPKNVVVVRSDAFAELDGETRAAVLAAAELAEQNGWRQSRRQHIERTAALRLRGAEVGPLPAQLKRDFYELGRKMTFDWTQRAGDDAVGIVESFYTAQ